MTPSIHAVRLFFLCAALVTTVPAGAQTDPFRGFIIDMSRLTPEQKQSLTPSYQQQIKIIEDANLPKEMLEFFKTVPTIIDPALSKGGKSAVYRRSKKDPKGHVVVDTTPIDPAKPVLLHEMLHAYDSSFWDFNHPVVLAQYKKAIDHRLYSAKAEKSHFLENPREYFAIAGTIYLVGTIKQEPYDCKIIAAKQTELVEFLERTFGPKPHCR
jgi:hypothetical protein